MGVAPDPSDAATYIQRFFILLELMIVLVAAGFGGSIIAEDFEKQTGNLLFPKVPKNRLLAARLMARFAYAATSIFLYYMLILIPTLVKFGNIPIEFWGSLMWAFLYLFMLLTVTTFFSSIMKRTSSAIILTIVILLLLFNMVSMIFAMAGVTAEPLFILTYYANIISSWLNMPEERFTSVTRMTPRGKRTTYSWATPDAAGALAGMIIISTMFLIVSYIIFKRRQNAE